MAFASHWTTSTKVVGRLKSADCILIDPATNVKRHRKFNHVAGALYMKIMRGRK